MNTYGGYLWAFDYSTKLHYSLTIIIALYALLSVRTPNKKDFTLCVILIILGIISYTFGTLNDYVTNMRAILVPPLFLLLINSKSERLLKPLFVLSLIVYMLEIILFYNKSNFWIPITRFHLVRPFGLFLDIHLSGLFLASSLFLFGHKYLGALVSILSLSLQTPISYSVVFIKRRNIWFFIIFSTIIIFLLYEVGHLEVDDASFSSTEIVDLRNSDTSSMANVYLSFLKSTVHKCYFIGCSTNDFNVEMVDGGYIGLFHDIGLMRALYFFGFPWLMFYVWFVFRISRSKVLPAIYFISLLHYPIVLGIITTALLAISINYYNKIVSVRQYYLVSSERIPSD
jgi:hypothetical protein